MSQPTLSRIPLLNLARQTAAIRPRLDAAVARVLDHGHYILGPEVVELEKRVAACCGTQFAVSCASGTDALLLPLMAYGAGPGHKVITSPFTFFATAGSISRLGAEPVFLDIDPEPSNLDPDHLERYLVACTAEEIRQIKAIIPIHLFGQCAQMDRIMDLSVRFDIPVIEDAAQAIGAEWNHKRAGSMGHCGAFSFFPSKNLGGAGDGGIITTNDTALADQLKLLRVHGGERRYYHRFVGINSRLDTLQAALLLAKFDFLDEWTRKRIDNAVFYSEQLGALGDARIKLPSIDPRGRHVFNQYTVRVPNRDDVKSALFEAGIASEVYYPVPLHLQECFAGLNYKVGDLPVSEAAAREVLSIPVDPELTAEERIRIVSSLAAAVA